MKRAFLLGLLLACASPALPAAAAVVETARLAEALEAAGAVPAFQQALLSQIQLAGALSAQPHPDLAPLAAPAAAPAAASDPWRAQAARLVGACMAQPAAAAAVDGALRAALGDRAADDLHKAAGRFERGRANDPGLDAQLRGMTRSLDFSDPAALQAFTARLYDGARAGPDAPAPPVAVPAGAPRRPLVTLSPPGESTAMTPDELAAYTESRREVSPRGLVRVDFRSGDYRPEYDAELARLGVDRVVIKEPSRREVETLTDDRHGFHLTSEKVRWVMTARTMAEHEAALADNSQGGKGSYASQFRKQLQKSEAVRTTLGPLTVADYERWYPIYEEEIVSKPGGKRNIGLDFARKQAEKGELKDWYGLFYYDDAGRMVGGDIYKGMPDRGMFVNGYAAYRPELKPSNPAVRAFEVGMRLALAHGYKVFSFGQDTNFLGYDYSLGLMANKAGFLLQPFPENEIILSKVIDTAKIASVKGGQGRTGGYGDFGIKGPLVASYLASRDAGTPKRAEELLGRSFRVGPDGLVRSETGLSSAETSVFWHYRGDSPDALRTPRGVAVVERRMAPPPSGD